jgi:aryl-phospho-beta-D-glucosidase BglC (GH1 family)
MRSSSRKIFQATNAIQFFKPKFIMKKLLYRFILPILIVSVFTFSCKEDAEAPVLSISGSDMTIPFGAVIPQITISELGGMSEITVKCNDKWRIINPGSTWLQVSQVSGNSGTSTIEVSAGLNETGFTRSTILTINSDNGQARRVTCSQPAKLYPSYNTSPQAPDATGMSSTAMQLSAKINLGISIGNTMEAPNEGEWQPEKITESYIKFLKEIGFNTVRLPCSWDWNHIINRETAEIDPAWLNRVKEVVGWCVANDMYVVVNIHWDNGWLERNITSDQKDGINAKQRAYWEQIATALRDFDEHLMFASANEPDAPTAEKMAILLGFHQTFINAVRSTGGKNTYRVLVIQGPNTDIERTNSLMNTLPKDPTPDKLMVEVHFYTPGQFANSDKDYDGWPMYYYWGTGNESTIEPERNSPDDLADEDEIVRLFGLMKSKFIDKGIPVMMGEYAAYRRFDPNYLPKDMPKHEASVNYWNGFVTKKMLEVGIDPIFWEVGFVLDRKNNAVLNQGVIDAVTK